MNNLAKATFVIVIVLLVGCGNPVQVSSFPEDIQFVIIPHGSFQMGAPSGEHGTQPDERPVHTVTFNYDFEMMTTEVTQRMWIEVMGNNPSQFNNPSFPVESITWGECQNFADAMNDLDPAHTYRLPSESEWEYCCRAGTTTRFYWGEDLGEAIINDYAFWKGNSGGTTHTVAGKLSNVWGLYDMSGNVWEWCEDWHHEDYNGAPDNGESWLVPAGLFHIIREGSWNNWGANCRSADRSFNAWYAESNLGFRLARTVR